MAVKVLVTVGMSVPMSEYPDGYSRDGGKVTAVNRNRNLVNVRMPNGKVVKFDIDGDSWSDCGEFKKDIPFVE